jgi:hypothetical protein
LSGGSLLRRGQAQVGGACAVTLFCLSNNSDVEVTGSLLLVRLCHVPFACFPLQTRQVRSIDSLSCADSEGHRPRVIGAPIRLLAMLLERTGVVFHCRLRQRHLSSPCSDLVWERPRLLSGTGECFFADIAAGT